MTINLIWAESKNNVIGKNGVLPWHFSKDINYFKTTTMGHPIVMGRKTADSLPQNLKGRRNIVLTRREGYDREGFEVMDIDDVLELEMTEDIFIIGGKEIYDTFLPDADYLFITVIFAGYVGDTYSPKYVIKDFKLKNIIHEVENGIGLSFLNLERIRNY